MTNILPPTTTLKPYPEGSREYQLDKQFVDKHIALYWENKKKKEAATQAATDSAEKNDKE